jgi:hypothetical protein
MIDYTTTNLIKVIKRRGSLPTNQRLFDADDFVALANDELQMSIVPLIMSVREEYFVVSEDFDIVPGQAGYDIPSDAVGMKLRDVSIVGSDGNAQTLPRLEPENTNNMYGFDICNNQVVLSPVPLSSKILRLSYMRRPNLLVTTANAGKIISIDQNTKEVTLTFFPSTWQTGDLVNAINPMQPFETVAHDLEIQNAALPVLLLDSVEGLVEGQWIALNGESPIPQIPVEAHSVLAQATVVKCLEALGDEKGIAVAEAKLKQNKADLLILINPRVDSSLKRITSNGNIMDF